MEKNIALTRQTFVGKVTSLLFNMLSRLVITFLPRSKQLLLSWLQSPSAVILEPQKIKAATVSPSICHEVMRADPGINSGYFGIGSEREAEGQHRGGRHRLLLFLYLYKY